MSNGQKIGTSATQGYHYPDGLVVCGKPVLDSIDEHAIANPTLLV
ncbi:MAG: Uma2 family endonuclease, partial [Sandaracinaceae bacterium]|nr:Uma2 family endonuclease [Sandaracinaceae bacterium]